ncbi:MAG: glycosyltransferase [Scytonema sp. PMC 1070.18]|nr:glycosyltransferase [Scytonema sp. PMC 1070.18]
MKTLKIVFLSNWRDNPYKTLLMNHLTHFEVEIEEYFWNHFFLPIFLPLVLQKGKFDILHLHFSLQTFIAGKTLASQFIKFILLLTQIFILKLIGIKLVLTVHEWHNKFQNKAIDSSYIQIALLHKLLHAIITHCETTKNEIIAELKIKNKHKVFVVPHGNYIGTYNNKIGRLEARAILGIPPKNLVFLIFGGIYRYKGVVEAIDAFKKLQQQKINLLIAGNIHEAKLEGIILKKIKGYENILFYPKLIPNDEIQIYLNACDCLVVPYKVFTTSGVAILGMSYGRACIAPNTGFFKDILDESGSFLYDSDNPYGLLQAMKIAVEKKDMLAEMGKYNFKVVEKWNWNYVSEQTLNIYQWCLGMNL